MEIYPSRYIIDSKLERREMDNNNNPNTKKELILGPKMERYKTDTNNKTTKKYSNLDTRTKTY